MDNHNYEQEIDLKDLMFAVFHKWRGIILVAVILGILLGGFKLGSGLINKGSGESVADTEETYAEDQDIYERTQALYELEIEDLKEKIKAQETYLTNSILMRISPYNKYTASAEVFVKTDVPDNTVGVYLLQSDPADGIIKAYEGIVKRADGLDRISGKSIDNQYIRELIGTNVDYEGNVLTISVAYTDEAGAVEILDALLNNLESKKNEIQEKLEKHDLIVMDEVVGVTADQGLAGLQQNNTNSFTTLQKNLADKEKAFEELVEPSQPSSLSAASSLKSGIKYGVLGGVLGAFLSIFCICVAFLMSDRLNSEKELKKRFGLRILGVFSQAPRKRAFAGVDGWLNRMEGKRLRHPAEVYEIMAVNVRNYMQTGKKILILGSASNDKMSEIAEELKKRVDGIEIQIGQDMEHYAETLSLLPEAGQIILVEERGKAKFEEIQSQVEVIRSLDKDIMGCVVL